MGMFAYRVVRRGWLAAVVAISAGRVVPQFAASPAWAAQENAAPEKNENGSRDEDLPKDPFARGRALFQQGKLEEALTAFQQAEEKEPRDPIVKSWLGYVQYRLNRHDEAITTLNRAIELRGDRKPTSADLDIHINLGNAYLAKGETDRAIEAYRKAVELGGEVPGKHPEPHYNLGNALVKKGELDGALAAYQEAERQDPNDPLIQNNLGYVYERKHTLDPQNNPIDPAIEHYRKAVDAQPDNPAFQKNLAQALRKKEGTSEQGFEALKRAVELDPGDYFSWLALGEEYQKRNETDQAINAYKKAAALRPEEFNPHYNLGIIYLSPPLRNYGEAIKHLQEANRLKPQDERALSALGYASLRANRLEDAGNWYEKAFKVNPNLQDAHANAGVVYDRLGQSDRAIQHWQTAVRLNPEDVQARSLLAAGYLNKQRYEQAIAEYRQVLQRRSDDAASWVNLGFAQEKLTRFDEALASYQRAIRSNPNATVGATAHNNLGAIYQRRNEREKARQNYQRALQLDPNFQDARRNLEQLGQLERQTRRLR